MWYVFGIGEVYTVFWWGNLRERDHLEDTWVDERIILKWIAGSGIGEVYAVFWWGNLRERDHLEDTGVDGRIILNWISGSGMR